MRNKIIVFTILLVLVFTVFLGLVGCNQDQQLPGISWAEEEVLEYDMLVDELFAGTMVVTTTRLPVGEYALSKFPEEKYSITSTSSRGTLITKSVQDLEGNEIMYSEALMNGFQPLVSYKEVKNGKTDYSFKIRYDKNKAFYSYNNAPEKKIQFKGAMDNEIMYHYIRCYEIESNYSTSINLLNPSTGKKETLGVSVRGEDQFGGFEYVNGANESNIAAPATKNIVIAFSRTKKPVGKSILVYYTIEDSEGRDGFYLVGNPAKGANNKSSHIPVKIEENDVVFLLSRVSCI